MPCAASSIRKTLAALTLAAAVGGIPGISHALEISVIGPDEITVAPGELFTIDAALTNDLRTPNIGIEIVLGGMTAAGATPIAGRSATDHLVDGCSVSDCFGGLFSIDNAFFDPDDLLLNYTEGIGARDPDTIYLAFAVSRALPGSDLTDNSGALDPGLDGPLDQPSARDFTLDLIANTIGTHVFTISGEFSDSIDVLPFETNTRFTVHVADRPANPVPEPSAALLFTLGTLLAATTIKFPTP